MIVKTIEAAIPARTQPRLPLTIQTSLLMGYIYRVRVIFPDGNLGAVGIKLRSGYGQFLPLDGWLVNNNKTDDYEVNQVLEGPPWVLWLDGYNQALDWPHTVRVTLEGE